MLGAIVLLIRRRFVFILTTLLASLTLACATSLPVIGSQQNAPPSHAEALNIITNSNEDTSASQSALGLSDTLIIPGTEPPTFDPHLSGDATSAEYVVEIFSGLMAYTPDLKLIPDIAASYKVSDDGLVYTFQLKPEAKFQDGKPVRASDFKWSFERACDPATRSYTADTYMGDIVGCRDKLQGQASEVKGVEAVDDLTLRLTIDEPKSFFLAKMTYPTAYVLDRENVASGPDWFTHPNGSGPYKLAKVDPNEIILEKNDNFYGEPKPTLARVIYLINVPVDLMTGYEHGLPDNAISSLGLPANAAYDIIPVSLANYYRATDPHNTLSQQFVTTNGLSMYYIGFNVNQPPFDDIKIRQALSFALDKPRIVKLMYRDTVPIANGIVPPGMPGYSNPNLPEQTFDPERAKQLIAESSYGDVSKLPPITLHVSTASDLDKAIYTSYETNLGLKISVEESSWADFLAELNGPNTPFQMYELGWIADYPDPQNFLEVLFHSKSAQNHGGYSNPKVDALLDEARGVQDEQKREALYQQAEQLILDDAACIPLTFDAEQWLIKPYVKNYQEPPIKVPKFQYISMAEH